MTLIDRLTLANQLVIMKALERMLPSLCKADRTLVGQLSLQIERTDVVLRDDAVSLQEMTGG